MNQLPILQRAAGYAQAIMDKAEKQGHSTQFVAYVGAVMLAAVSANEKTARAVLSEVSAEHNREQPTGRYAPDPTRLCRCGHSLGEHLAEGRVAERECCRPGCTCRGFKRVKP